MEIVRNNPNKSVLSIALNPSELANNPHLLPFNRFSIAKADADSGVSDFASFLASKLGDFSRFDFVKDGDKATLSIVRKLPWSEDGLQKGYDVTQQWQKSFVNAETLTAKFNALSDIDTSRDLVQLVLHVMKQPEVQAKLAADGGDIVIDNVPYISQDSSFTANVILMGSCKGCNKATEGTLSGIEDRIRTALDGWKASDHENELLQSFKFAGIKPLEIQGSFYQRDPNIPIVRAEKKRGWLGKILG